MKADTRLKMHHHENIKMNAEACLKMLQNHNIKMKP